MSYADAVLRLLQPPDLSTPVALTDAPEPKLIWRLNPRAGVRCPQCGRMFRKVRRLPVQRTCVMCHAVYAMQRDPDGGVHFQQVSVPEALVEARAEPAAGDLHDGWLHEALSSSPQQTPLTRGPLSEQVVKEVHRELVRLGRELAEQQVTGRYEADRRLSNCRVYLQWLERMGSLLRPHHIVLEDRPVRRNISASSRFWNGAASPRIPGSPDAPEQAGVIRLWTNGHFSVEDYLSHRQDNFRHLTLDYMLTMRHEATHLLQGAQIPDAVHRQYGQRVFLSQRGQTHPGSMGYHSSPMEIDAVANEIAELITQGKQVRDYPLFQRFLRQYGRDHPATKRLLKKTVQILQQEGKPEYLALLKRQLQRS